MPVTLQCYATVDDAGAALRVAGARNIGGGTLLVRQANESDPSVTTLVRTTDPTLAAIEITRERARIGAGVTMAAISRHPGLDFFARVVRSIGGPAIRNMATVGGNLFAPPPFGDAAVALLALDATVNLSGGAAPIEAFLVARGGAHADAIVTSVDFALPPPGAFRFVKVSRVKPKGAAVVTIAALLAEADGVIAAARIALGGMADRPIRAGAAEQALLGRPRGKDGIAPALAVALDGTAAISDAIASAWYRREVLPVHLGRLLLG
jgi:CO/xanthine dehydrogenase FAD-binding subunit